LLELCSLRKLIDRLHRLSKFIESQPSTTLRRTDWSVRQIALPRVLLLRFRPKGAEWRHLGRVLYHQAFAPVEVTGTHFVH
jgi:hypothetical protein